MARRSHQAPGDGSPRGSHAPSRAAGAKITVAEQQSRHTSEPRGRLGRGGGGSHGRPRGTRLVSKSERARVEIVPAPYSEPLSPEQVIAENAEYIEAIREQGGTLAAKRVVAELVQEMEESRHVAERRAVPDDMIRVIRLD